MSRSPPHAVAPVSIMSEFATLTRRLDQQAKAPSAPLTRQPDPTPIECRCERSTQRQIEIAPTRRRTGLDFGRVRCAHSPTRPTGGGTFGCAHLPHADRVPLRAKHATVYRDRPCTQSLRSRFWAGSLRSLADSTSKGGGFAPLTRQLAPTLIECRCERSPHRFIEIAGTAGLDCVRVRCAHSRTRPAGGGARLRSLADSTNLGPTRPAEARPLTGS